MNSKDREVIKALNTIVTYCRSRPNSCRHCAIESLCTEWTNGSLPDELDIKKIMRKYRKG